MAGRKKSTVIKFMETSSMKGLPRIVRAPNPLLRMIWLLGFLFGMAMAIYYLYALLAVYLSHTSVTSISEGHSNVTFPDVTVCNLNPISNLEDGEIRYAEHVNTVSKLQQENTDNRQLAEMLAYLMTPQGFLQNIADNQLHSDVSSNFSVTCDWWSTDSHNRPPLNCSQTITHRFLSASAGHCLTFHAPEYVNGLTAIFFLDDFAYISLPDFDVSSQQVFGGGGSVVLHEPGTLPDIEGSMAVPSGYHSEFDLYTSTRIRLSKPYSYCEPLEDIRWPPEVGIDEKDNVKYAYYTCVQLCKQATVIHHCDCISPNLLSTEYMRQRHDFCGKVHKLENGEYHEKTILSRYKCYLESEILTPICECPTPCRENFYHFKYVQAKWPHPSFALPFYQKYIKKMPYAYKFNNYDEIEKTMAKNKSAAFDMLWKEEKMQQNFFHLKVYFGTQRLDVTYEDKPAVGSETLWGNVGGTLNLWMGVSFVTLVELVELVYHLLWSYRGDDKGAMDRDDSYHSSRSRNTSESGDRSKRDARNGTFR